MTTDLYWRGDLFVHERINRQFDVVAEPCPVGLEVRMFRDRGASDAQVARVRRAIEAAGHPVEEVVEHPTGDVTYWLDLWRS